MDRKELLRSIADAQGMAEVLKFIAKDLLARDAAHIANVDILTDE